MGVTITQENIVLRSDRLIKERVTVFVHLHVVVAHMTEKHDTIVLSNFNATVEIEIGHQHGVSI